MKNNNVNDLNRYAGLGFRMVVIILFFVLAGLWLDKELQLQKPWFTIFGALFSVPLSLYAVLRELLKKE